MGVITFDYAQVGEGDKTHTKPYWIRLPSCLPIALLIWFCGACIFSGTYFSVLGLQPFSKMCRDCKHISGLACSVCTVQESSLWCLSTSSIYGPATKIYLMVSCDMGRGSVPVLLDGELPGCGGHRCPLCLTLASALFLPC